MKALVSLAVAAALLAAAAPAALGASAGKSGDVITVTGTNASERIEVTFDAVEGNYEIADLDPSDVPPAPGCVEDDDNNQSVDCPAAGTARFVVNLGGGVDGVQFTVPDANAVPARIDGGPGDDCGFVNLTGTIRDDEIDGGDGDDCLAALAGNDQLDAGAGDDDEVLGGPGNDTIDAGPGNDGDSDLDGEGGDDIVDGGDGDDNVGGGPGVDTVRGGAGADRVRGNAEGDDVLGGAGDDILLGGTGADDVFGEAGDDILIAGDPGDADVLDGDEGLDRVDYTDFAGDQPASITFDAQPNDGAPGEGDNVLDMEDIEGGAGDDNLRGSDSSEISVMQGFGGNDTINPGTLEDIVFGGFGNDTLDTRDGFTDRVSCGPGTDTVAADSLDVVAPDCETNTVEQRTPARDVPEDRPPTVTFTAPTPGASLTAPTTLTADATDDRGVARVLFVDEDRPVCVDDTAPYTCAYQPRGEDVGRNTLSVVAVDTADQTAFATRTVLVPRFSAALSVGVTPRRDRRVPFRFTTSGRLTLPAGVTPALGCKGAVTVQIKSRANTISTRRARVGADCRYRSHVTFRATRRLVTNRLAVTATFGGNDVLVRRVSRRATVTVRR